MVHKVSGIVLGLVLMLVTSAVDADVGFIAIEDGYQSTGDAYWWKDGVRYTRSLVSVPTGGYYSCGRYYSYAPTYRWNYTVYQQAAAYTPPAVPAYGPDWKVQLLKYAQARDDYELYDQSLGRMGFRGQNYSFQQQANYGGYGNLGSYGVNGQTQYNYTLQSIREAYGSTDLNALYQQAARLVAGAQGLAQQANTEHSTLVSEAGTNAARVAEILARAESARRVLAATAPQDSSRTVTTIQGQGASVSTGPPATMPPATGTPGNGGGNPKLAEYIKASCLNCHEGPGAKKGFRLDNLATLKHSDWGMCVSRMARDDPAKRMPYQQPPAPDWALKLFADQEDATAQ